MRLRYVVPPLAVALAVVIYLTQDLQAPPAEIAEPVQEPPRYVVTGAQWLRLNLRGEPEFRAQAESIEYYSDDSVRLHALNLDALGGLTSPWNLQAPEGSARVGERRLLLSGEVLATGKTAEGAPLDFTTERLWVDLLRRELRTETPVVLKSDFRRATARGLKADFNGERIQLLNDVQMEYAPES